MAKYLIDAHLPYYFSLWNSEDYVHVYDLDDEWKDWQIWDYAQAENLTIVTKDSDFSDRIMLAEPPPRVIHIKLGNMRMNQLHRSLTSIWQEVCQLSELYKLVQVFEDRMEGIGEGQSEE